MTGDEDTRLGEQVAELKSDLDSLRTEVRDGFNRLNNALLGGYDGAGGLLGRVRANEDTKREHEKRLIMLEDAVAVNTKWREGLTAQWRLLMLLGGGNLLGLLGLAYAIMQMTAKGG